MATLIGDGKMGGGGEKGGSVDLGGFSMLLQN